MGSDHTQANFLSAFYQSTASDSNSYEQWLAEGSLDSAKRANAQWKALLAYIEKRKASMPDASYA